MPRPDLIPKAIRLTVTGRVQGVGFRPTVYRVATALGLFGDVRNTSRGVVIEVEGAAEALERFQRELPGAMPGLAAIKTITCEETTPRGRTEFLILPSEECPGGKGALIPYDVATCDTCLQEIVDPQNRRFHYPFTNCTLCGPRYTIIESVPYDRPKTSMKVFPMCPECVAEYRDPRDRRYHAQPNACALCGPHLYLVDSGGAPLPGDPLEEARARLRRGEVLAVRGVGGFHLAADATNIGAVTRLRERKRRGEKPFAVLCPDLAAARRVARVNLAETTLLQSDRRPIVLLDKPESFPLAEQVAPGNPRVGVMLPYSPLHHLLCADLLALVMTSGNLSEEPIARDNTEALQRLSGMADAFLLHDRDILMSCDDSVVYDRGDGMALVRRSRGFAPDPLPLPDAADGILAVGAQLKNTFCLTRGGEAFLSQHIGDLENLETYEHFVRCFAHLTELLGVKPTVVACDLHPDFLSTRHALAMEGVRVVQVQHHHAHLAAAMADRGLEGEVIGLCLDGTGLGEDGTIWGGEVLVGGFAGFRRAARLAPFLLPGGDAAIHEPWRTALGLLLADLGRDAAARFARSLSGVDPRYAAGVTAAAERRVNTPETSSLGRLFDAVAAILSIRLRVDYDGQAAVALEAAAAGQAVRPLKLSLRRRDELIELDHRPLVEGLLAGREEGVPLGELSAGFHAAVVDGLVQACLAIREAGGSERVVLSGGCLMNRRLDAALEGELCRKGFSVFVHRQVPANDGGLSLGQAAVAAARVQR